MGQHSKIHYTDPLGKARDWEFCSRKTRVAGAQVDGEFSVSILICRFLS